MSWNLSFIREEELIEHVRATIQRYGDKLESFDLRRFNKNIVDPVKLVFDKTVYRASWEETISNEIFRQRDKSNNNDIGYFHQRIFQYIKNCHVPPNGEEGGWDVIYSNPDGIHLPDGSVVHTVYVEMKNKHNTMNSTAAAKTFIKMQAQLLNDDDCACFLVEAIAKKSQNIKWETTVDKKKVGHKLIRRVSMDQFYALVTGQADAFMKIFNTMSGKKEELKTINEGEVKIYACGPTVYNYIHIGNARPICVFDTFRRYLEYRGYKVTFVQNFTDIDDKIIKRANEENSDYLTVSEKYIAEYKKDAKGLNVREASVHPRATENVQQIIDMVKTLEEKGYAYSTEYGDVYFRTNKFKEYGKLSHQPLEDLEAGARIQIGETKEDPMDFALWKGAKPGEPSWDSPWGKGRPGWHIECSTMAKRYLGETIDIHCGGQDLVFPHHENEIAQSECCNGVPFAHYWMHNGYINVDNKKMSKSLNNFFTVRDVAEKYGYEPIRYLMLSSHYRSPINYSIDIIKQCQAALDRLYNCREDLRFLTENSTGTLTAEEEGDKSKELLLTHKADFITAMDDDFNTADGITALFELARDINSNLNPQTKPSKELCEFALSLYTELADVLGLLYTEKEKGIDEEVQELIDLRTQARQQKNWAEADRIRDELKARGITIKDTPNGTIIVAE